MFKTQQRLGLFLLSRASNCRRIVSSSRSKNSKIMAATLISGDTFFLDHFALRQWNDANFAGTRMNCDQQEFVEKVHAHFKSGGSQLIDGYAPFCKHVFIPNEWGCPVGALNITDENRHLLTSAYTRRRQEELPVLTRWFPLEKLQASHIPTAKYLDIILYSREQMIKEYEALPLEGRSTVDLPDAPWGIISIKAQNEPFETPMTPITMMRVRILVFCVCVELSRGGILFIKMFLLMFAECVGKRGRRQWSAHR